ncbi:nuclear nucleic acid-binding protein C1D-like [Pararge aegeria]|uniref:Nuclear nucleic acid-binding protein C1D n=1 Tax=Pararge aegeria TaxID=116150 RepID=S4P8H6_9NEOP|nr:nuclear nucleic acid-binding protein C1D-like [Pararge aegeria]
MIDYRNIQYGELAQDADFANRYESLKEALTEMQAVLDNLLPLRQHYDSMDLPQRIEYDIFLAYTMNSLYWVHLRILGIDPTTTPIKDELNRTKVAMMKWKEIKDKSKRPTVDIQAAKRFINSGLYDRFQGAGQPKNKKIKFNEQGDQV